jgi:hypothetical protein
LNDEAGSPMPAKEYISLACRRKGPPTKSR